MVTAMSYLALQECIHTCIYHTQIYVYLDIYIWYIDTQIQVSRYLGIPRYLYLDIYTWYIPGIYICLDIYTWYICTHIPIYHTYHAYKIYKIKTQFFQLSHCLGEKSILHPQKVSPSRFHTFFPTMPFPKHESCSKE